MPCRLLFLSERYAPDLGGVATSAQRIARALAELGATVDVIAWTRSLQAGLVAPENGNPAIYRMGRFREWDATMLHTQNLVDWLMRERSYDAIWGHYLAPAGFLSCWIGKRRGIPATVSIRGNDLDRDMFPPGDFARLEWTLANAHTVSAVTRELAGKVSALAGRADTVTLSNVVDSTTFRPAEASRELRERLGVLPDEAVLGFAGELREKKGQQFLLEAIRRVREQRPACLLIIGEVRPSELPRLIQWTGPGSLAEHRILVTGQLATPEEVNAHLNLCDVYLQPSLWDGMPNALLEAMAAARFCIGSDAGGIPEIIDHGVNGVVLPRWELHRLGEVVLEWLGREPAQRERIGQAARDRMLRSFGAEQERRQLQAILARLIPSSS